MCIGCGFLVVDFCGFFVDFGLNKGKEYYILSRKWWN
jgi:hypothetical protein